MMVARHKRGVFTVLTIGLLISHGAVAQESGEAAPSIPPLEFWPQTFHHDHPILRLLTLPLLRDDKLKQFKTLYYRKLGEGMDVAQVDARMELAFRRYDETCSRTELMAELREIESLLTAYDPPHYTDEQVVYVAMGASISQGGGASPASNGWVYLVADRLRSIHPNARVRNLAVGGTTTKHAREVQLPLALACFPDLVTYTSGMNDLQYGEPVESARENVDAVLRELRSKTNARIILTLMPSGDRFPVFSLGLAKLEQRKKNVSPQRVADFNAVFRSLAGKHGAELVDIGVILDEATEQAEVDALFSFDGIHPNNAGHARVADVFWPAIKQAIHGGR
ncbi:MAG: SGNH/GDSL hydrolase family protein [Planctomycetes bacterium]|nr:SGNH/GDSL hydrolase family protein [Planctomycetota bacterium]